MAGFEDLVKQVGSSVGGSLGSSQGLVEGVVQMLTGPKSEGLNGFVKTFQDKGLGDVVKSWVSTGPNLPITATQVQQVFGPDTVKSLAAKAGLTPEVATTQLAALLPAMVDKLTPEGKVPAEGILAKALSFVK